MSEITDIKVAKGKKARRHIYLDDNYACTLDEFTVFKYKLKIGQSLTIEDLERISMESEVGTAFEKAVDLISTVPKTRKQIYDNLRGKGYLPSICDSVLDKLTEYRYIDDESYARLFVETYKERYGIKKIEFLLLQKGVNKGIIDTVLADMDSQADAIMLVANKYMQSRDKTPQNYEKLYRHLASKGFSWDDIVSAVNKLKKE